MITFGASSIIALIPLATIHIVIVNTMKDFKCLALILIRQHLIDIWKMIRRIPMWVWMISTHWIKFNLFTMALLFLAICGVGLKAILRSWSSLLWLWKFIEDNFGPWSRMIWSLCQCYLLCLLLVMSLGRFWICVDSGCILDQKWALY